MKVCPSPPFIYLLSHYFSIDVPILSLVYHPISHYFMAQIVLYLTSEFFQISSYIRLCP